MAAPTFSRALVFNGCTARISRCLHVCQPVLSKRTNQRYKEAGVVTSNKTIQPINKRGKELSVAPEVKPTVEKPEPVDGVYFTKFFRQPALGLLHAVEMHREYAQPDMADNMHGLARLCLQLDMSTKKKTKFLKDLNTILKLPHPFKEPNKKMKKIIAFCKEPEDVAKAFEMGAKYAGSTDVIKQIESGEILLKYIDLCVCTNNTFSEVLVLRKKLGQTLFPNPRIGTLSSDIEQMMDLFVNGHEIQSKKIHLNVAELQVSLGPLSFTNEQLMENTRVLMQKICEYRPRELGPFILTCSMICPPSPERFLVDIKPYTEKQKTDKDDDSSDSDSDSDSDDEEDGAAVTSR